MKRNQITVVLNDSNRFYVEGLINCINDNFSSVNMKASFSDCIFNNRAKWIFLAADAVSVANLHYLNRRTSTRSLSVFIIYDDESENIANNARIKALGQYTPIYRTQSVAEVSVALRRHLEAKSDLRDILIPPCSSRTNNTLTRRETEILRYLARGISNGAVARFLHISEKTVSAHKRNIMSKLNMIRSAELNYWLLQEGWCESWRAREK